MTAVIHSPTPKAANTPQPRTMFGHIQHRRTVLSIHPKVPAVAPAPTPVQRQQEIENALSMALWHIRQANTTGIHAATVKAIRAVSMLKQACEEVTA